MRNLVLITLLTVLSLGTSALAQEEISINKDHALGNMYTKALNMAEAKGLLDTIEPRRHVRVNNIYMDHGAIYMVITEEKEIKTIMFDPIANRIVPLNEEAEPPLQNLY